MKCIAAVVMMVLVTAEASWAPLAYSYPQAALVQDNSFVRYVAAPWDYAAVPSAVPYAAYNYNYHPTAYVQAPVAPVAVVAQKEARYLAVNRGAVHDAPLTGHSVSQQSLNLASAPGTL
ncbi:AAEL002223-PA [Aedes aegypti]|uniref:AAEL002223-PA n=2 Tax=Aedes aegypti TaxID=7159 RepID=A0A1S4F151_AEDAE|nr:adult cuticle protein 1 [Aedes aegypti]EAT46607.1 AAEL002223-PA [Aedes aegypti]